MYVVKPPTAANRADAPGRRVAPRPRPTLRRAGAPALALALLLAAGCAAGSGRPGDGPATPLSPAVYPDLASVPPRPQLGYTIEQRNGIADALVADRANALRRQADLARATGGPAGPPPEPAAAAPSPADAAAAPPRVDPSPPSAPAPPAAPAPPVAGDGRLARGYVEANLNDIQDNGRLRKFLRRVERPIPDPYGPRTVTQLLGLAPEDPAAANEGAADALNGFGSFLGGVLGLERAGGGAGDGPAPPDAGRR